MAGLLRGEWWREARRLMRSAVYHRPGERADCAACGSPSIFDLDVMAHRGGRIGFVSGCDECGFVFTNPQPTAQELAEFYSPAGAWGQPRSGRERPAHVGRLGASWRRAFEPIHEALRIEAPPAGARVLDFGCGDGRLLDQLQACGWETWGIETSMDTAFERHGRLASIPATPTFDLVIAHHVLEHVPGPLDVLRQFWAASRPGGFLYVSVPRLDTLPQHRDYKYVLNGRSHISAYTWACLRTLMARAGWAPVAEPPDEVSQGRGERTRSRLRVLARRADAAIPIAGTPAAEARAAIRDYYARDDRRHWLARMGFLRLAARVSDIHRRRAAAARKAERQQAAVRGPL